VRIYIFTVCDEVSVDWKLEGNKNNSKYQVLINYVLCVMGFQQGIFFQYIYIYDMIIYLYLLLKLLTFYKCFPLK